MNKNVLRNCSNDVVAEKAEQVSVTETNLSTKLSFLLKRGTQFVIDIRRNSRGAV